MPGPTFTDRARATAKGVTFAFGDEIEAGLRALAQRDPSAYAREVARIRREMKSYEDANPYEALAFEGAGAILPGMVPGVGAARMAQLAARAPRLARYAPEVAMGAAYGAGEAEGLSDLPRSMLEEGVLAALGYGVANKAGKLAKTGYGKAKQAVSKFGVKKPAKQYKKGGFTVKRRSGK
jgi:hypothetical protein